MKTFVAALMALSLAACAGALPPLHASSAAEEGVALAPVTPNPASAEEDTCAAAQFAGLLGHPAADIDRAALPPRTRVITPDAMVTQDYAPTRLNIHVSSEGRVSSLRCG